MGSPHPIYEFEGFRLDLRESRLTQDGRDVALQPKVLDFLALLVERSGQLVTREQLLEALWPDVVVNEEALTQTVRKLRRALGDSPKEPRFVETVTKRGYRFLPEVRLVELDEPTPQPSPVEIGAVAPEARTLAPPGPPKLVGRAPWLVGLAVLGAAVLFGASRLHSAQSQVAQTLPSAAASVASTPAEPPLGQVRRLTSSVEREQQGRFSPDAKSVVYAANDPNEGQLDLYVSLLAGGNRVRITHTPEDESDADYAPDGASIVFARSGSSEEPSSIWTALALGGGEQRVTTNAGSPSFSPDGREIAFVRRADQRWEIRRCQRDGSAERLVGVHTANIESLAWSPDGQRLAFTDVARLWIVPADASAAPRPITEPASYIRSVSWDPSNGDLVTDANWGGRSNLWRVPLDGRAPVALTRGGDGQYHPALSRDGRRLLYVRESKQNQLWRSMAGRPPELLPTKTTLRCADASPDGARLAYADDDGPNVTIGLFDLSAHTSSNLGAGDCPAFSPDGKQLAFVGHAPDDGVWVLDLQTHERRRVSHTPARELRSAWSPDARQLAFVGGTAARAALVVVAVAGDAAERQLATGSFGAPAWSPDGRSIAVSGSADGSSGLLRIDGASGAVSRLSPLRSYSAAPLWSKDGRTLSLLVDERHQPALAVVSVQPGGVVSRRSLDAQPDPSFWGVFDVRPLPSGGLVYQQERYESDLYVLER